MGEKIFFSVFIAHLAIGSGWWIWGMAPEGMPIFVKVFLTSFFGLLLCGFAYDVWLGALSGVKAKDGK